MPGSKVLLVEDSKFLRFANERALVRAGYEVITASDGEEALKAADEKHPDVVLLDLMIPKVTGPDVLKKLKANPETAPIPVIILSSLSQRNEEKLIKDGAAAYFEKEKLDLEKNSDRLAAMVANVLCQEKRAKART